MGETSRPAGDRPACDQRLAKFYTKAHKYQILYQSSTQYQVSILVTKASQYLLATRDKKAENGSVTGGLAKIFTLMPSSEYSVPST